MLIAMASLSMAGIVAAGVVPVLLGMIWYHPRIFGTQWMRLTGITPETAERVKRKRLTYGILALAASMLIAYVMDVIAVSVGISSVVEAVRLGFWLWAGFAVPILLGSVIWEGQRTRLYFINIGYWLIAFIMMAMLLYILSFS